MSETALILVLLIGLIGLFRWAFRVLPQEQWQFVAVVPTGFNGKDWNGRTITYYGVLTACAVCVAVSLLIFLLGSMQQTLSHIFLLVMPLLLITVPSAKIIARLVEQKPATLTIGGASFTGMLSAPWAVLALNEFFDRSGDVGMPMMPALAALWIAYAFGEGIGRLACISFGCCYGKPLSTYSPIVQHVFQPLAFRFTGSTKKAVYEGHLESVPLFPIQGMTALVNSGVGLLGTLLFLEGWFFAAVVVSAIGTQGWRIVSEYVRMDYRGAGTVSLYQWMALSGALYSIVVAGLWRGSGDGVPRIEYGLAALGDIHVLLLLQILWLGIFCFTGISRVTRATMSTQVWKERI
jgi:hypothetical protein